ncbi:MAG: hypothetical protein AB7Q17_10490 [Phycisphaerae bacterium]
MRDRVVVVAPVVNLAGVRDFDALRFTDAVASELLSFPGFAAVPVNLTLATLARAGLTRVESAEDALALAEELNADGTLVVGVTEYDPYDPPRVGLVMQWYPVRPGGGSPALDPVATSRASGELPVVELSGDAASAPRRQVQRTFYAADAAVRQEIERYARGRGEHDSPYGWRRVVVNQELYVRYCCWALIRSMLEPERPSEPVRDSDGARAGT